MQKVRLYIFLGLLSLLFGCEETSFDCLKKAGDTETVSIALPLFHSINAYDGVNIILKEGNEQEVKLTAGENLIDKIKLTVDSIGFLNVSNENTCNWVRDYKDLQLHITMDTLHRINQYGYGQIRSEGILHFTDFMVNAKDGTGDVSLAVENKKLYIVSNSIANFYLSGTTEHLIVGFYYNDGICYAQELKANKVNVTHLGTNSIKIDPLDLLTGNIQSRGDILCYGSPESIKVKITGDGKLVMK